MKKIDLLLNKYIPGGAQTYSRGFDQFPDNAPGILIKGVDQYTYDEKNKKYLDYGMGLRSVILGYSNSKVNKAAIKGISKGNKVKFKEGMILSNEPGYYENGKFGIRIENLITVKKVNKSFKFENLTLAPIDKSLIEKNLLNKTEITWLNNYHSEVFINLKKYMNKSELVDLKNSCSNI